jgi:hypothetical protein
MSEPLSPSWNTKDMATEIVHELGKTVAKLGAQSDLLSILGSFRDTLSDEEVLSMLREWNDGGPTFSGGVVACIKVHSEACTPACADRAACSLHADAGKTGP